jgi:hypothetical protein
MLFAVGLVALGCATGADRPAGGLGAAGLAMGAGLYEAAFATLVRLYGSDARNSITGITLIAGFASTVGWPLVGVDGIHATAGAAPVSAGPRCTCCWACR